MNERKDDTPKPATDIDAIIYASGLTRPDAERVHAKLESAGWEIMALDYDHAKLARMYVSVIRDICEMQTAMCRIMEESTDPATAKIARDAFMHIPPKQ